MSGTLYYRANWENPMHQRILAFRSYGPGAPMTLKPIIGESIFGERIIYRCAECNRERTIFMMYDDRRDIKEQTGTDYAILTVSPNRVCCFDCFERKFTPDTTLIQVADNVILICPMVKAFKSIKTLDIIEQYGGLKLI